MNSGINRLSSDVSNSMNRVANNMNKVPKSKMKVVWYMLGAIILIFVLLMLVLTLNYLFTDCYQAKGFGQYLSDFDFKPCASKYKPDSYKERKLEDEKEVFHISNQDYSYRQAKCKCAAYGARLATESELAAAYNKGANWCSYGWSQGQNAYYPIQKCYWDELQRGDKRWRNSCGEPGLNGGFFANKELKFGANCYGVKPKGSLVKLKEPECKRAPYCKRESNKRAAERLDTDDVAPFSEDKWSQY